MQTALHSLHLKAGAQFRDYFGWEVPEHFGSFDLEYRAVKQAVGVVDLSFRRKLAASGADRQDFLHRMLTNEINALQPGEGNYCFLLNAQGHILADLNVLVEPQRILLDTEPFLTGKVLETLDRFIIMDQVELEDLSPRLGTIGLEGPLSREVVRQACGVDPPACRPLAHFSPEGDPDLLAVYAAGTGQGLWIIAPTNRLPQLWESLVEAAATLQGRPIGFAALEAARIEAGIPRYGSDIEERSLPQETGQLRAISYTKGCYPGQEVVERVRSRGHVNRRLVGLLALSSEPLRLGAKIQAEGRDIGHVTSATRSPSLGKTIALGYVRREFSEPGSKVAVEGAPAEVAPLPFPPAPAPAPAETT